MQTQMTTDDVDFWPLSDIAELQRQHWELQRDHILRRSDFYQRRWRNLEVPRHLEGVGILPLTTKADLRESQAAAPLFGKYLAVPKDQIIRLHRSSGTTGRPMNIGLTQNDAIWTAKYGARANRAAGLGPGHTVIHCLNYQLWLGGYTDHSTLEATGATVVPFGVGGSRLLIRTVREVQATALYCTPSYPAVLEQILAEHFPGVKPRDLGLKIAILTGEPGLENLEFRARVEETWGFAGRNIYGLSEVLASFASQCEYDNHLHFVGLDFLYPEIINPENGDIRTWEPGTTGELVLTQLRREAQPLVRFRTGDIITVVATDRCACGRAVPRFTVLGRSDDMVIVRGVNIFPRAVAAILNRFPELSGEFRIVLKGTPPYNRLPVQAELASGQAASPGLVTEIEEVLRDHVRATAEVTLCPPLSLPRSEGKSRRVVRGEKT